MTFACRMDRASSIDLTSARTKRTPLLSRSALIQGSSLDGKRQHLGTKRLYQMPIKFECFGLRIMSFAIRVYYGCIHIYGHTYNKRSSKGEWSTLCIEGIQKLATPKNRQRPLTTNLWQHPVPGSSDRTGPGLRLVVDEGWQQPQQPNATTTSGMPRAM
ncbi:uncharacterized protein TRIVIDRAFT_68650 [Trichoderma virens Gv29-8]|uniref:Uncharacterized protein n=1 Tax=Hypocrea virens (strain Gv29-8 / FGSC 10586) TaxID=413071 RepID=G9MZM0_HYPVG|nr:uncharacterized protein TRIVIDRAFT_68650 [Trichoderma virens Gv29-8]EHK20076.1 hypothetical protein TRIVIDRAFT_68650 [Trichoderma virens Gv29-8]